MTNNVYRFRQSKWGEPKRFKLIADRQNGWLGWRFLSGLIIVCVLIGLVTGKKLLTFNVETASFTSVSVRVIDGDTISLEDGKPNVRLVGLNAPETGNRARCEAERQKGEAAKQRLRELVSNGRPDFQQIACSCPSGTEGTNACNFGRRCGSLRVNGVDVGSILINEGLAVRFVCGATSCPTLPRPWC